MFNVQRGVRQGKPSSLHLFLSFAEILSSLPLPKKKKKVIKRFQVKDKEILFAQFADDTSLR